MRFYNKYYKNNYEEFITSYYPRFYREIFEMVEILKVQGKLIDELEYNIEKTYLNNFILTADLETVKTWERILKITYTKTLTLEQRKNVIIGRISGYGHIGESEIRAVISHYTQNSVTINFSLGVIYITIDDQIFDENNLLGTLLRRIPAHLALNVCVHTKRTFRNILNIKFGGAICADYTENAGNMFYHTHIKSKLIG